MDSFPTAHGHDGFKASYTGAYHGTIGARGDADPRGEPLRVLARMAGSWQG